MAEAFGTKISNGKSGLLGSLYGEFANDKGICLMLTMC